MSATLPDDPTDSPPLTLHGSVLRVARQHPDRVAIVDRGVEMSYRELDRRSAAVAARLAASGVGQGDRVAVLTRRSAEQLAVALGVLRIGAAYVPLDPAYPRARLRYLVGDADAAAIATDSAWAELASELHRNVIDAAVVPRAETRDETRPPPNVAEDGDVAYVIYTSGSTGEPKGVEVTHGNVLALLEACNSVFELTCDDVWSYFHSFAFDFSVWEIWGALTTGARVLVVPRNATRDYRAFGEVLTRAGVTVLSQTPSSFGEFLRAAPAYDGRALRYVVFGGERLDPTMLATWFASRGDDGPRMINMYGITETTVHVTYREITARDAGNAGSSPVGRPLPHLTIELRDAGSESPDEGSDEGEIVVAGTGVARGYLGRPGLTDERFLTLPDGRRAYRSGDLGRRLPDGGYEVLGRIDDQLSLHGFRIERGEIVAALRAHRLVADAVVVLDAQPRLVAYVVGTNDGPVDPAALRQHLETQLPAHMVPAVYVAIDSIPLTPNGKLDRDALPAPDARSHLGLGAAADVESERERLIATAYARVTGIDDVGRDDGFFALGGDSLGAARVAVSLTNEFGVDVCAADVYATPRVRDLAEQLSRRPPREVGDPSSARTDAPLTPGQLGIWIDERLRDGPSAYLESVVLDVQGDLDLAAFTRACAAVARRHPALRLRVTDGHPLPRQHVAAPTDDAVVASYDASDSETHSGFVEDARSRRFDLAIESPFRVTVVRRDAKRHTVVIVLHHLVTDEAAYRRVLHDIAAEYRRADQPLPEPSPDAERAYLDAVARLAEVGESDEGEAAREHWRQALEGTDLRLAFAPSETPRERRAASFVSTVDAGVTDRVARLAREHGLTPHAFELAAFALVVGRFAGTPDVVLGAAVSQRDAHARAELVAYLLQVVPLRVQLTLTSDLVELAEQVSAEISDARTYAAAPFDGSSPDGVRSIESPFQVVVTRRSRATEGFRLDGLATHEPDLAPVASKFDLAAFFETGDRSSVLRVEYRPHRIDRDLVERIVGHVHHTLAVTTEHPHDPLESLDLLPHTEVDQLAAWNRTASAYPRDADIPQVFREVAREHAARPAVSDDESSITYAELDARSDAVAAALAAADVTPGDTVAVLIGRSVPYVVAILGALKAGAAYVPLDPEWPSARRRQLLDAVNDPVIVVSAQDDAPHPGDARVVIVEAADRDSPPDVPAEPLRVANVLFTSGSTGAPKGVRVPHRAILRLVLRSNVAQPEPTDAWLAMAATTFDASTLELWMPLLNGAAVVIIPDRVPTPDRLRRAISRGAVTSAWLTVSLFNTIVDLDVGALRGLRHCFVGGEVVSRPHLARAMAALPDVTFVNGYGPTENTVFTCCHRITESDVAEGARVPLGGPVSNTTVHVLDDGLRPVPIRAPGELCTGGDGVALGYLDRDPHRADPYRAVPFVPDPFAPGARLYRTGDLVRRRADGLLEFLGRRDDQIKLHGFRIEPAEITAALASHPDVARAAVAISGAGTGRRLVGYAVPADGDATLDEAAVLQSVARRLPAHMVPAELIVLDDLPRRPSGKLDRDRLPVPAHVRSSGDAPSREPQNDVERALLEIWRGVLDVPDLGVDDDFFAAGGGSLQTIEMLTRVQDELGARLPVAAVVRVPTVAGLAEEIELTTGEIRALPPELVALRPTGEGDPVFCVPGIGGHVLAYRGVVERLATSAPVWGLEVQELDRRDRAFESMESIAAHLMRAMRVVQPSGPYHLLGYSFGGNVAWEMAVQLRADGDEVRFLGLIDAFPPGVAVAVPKLTKAWRHARKMALASPMEAAAYFLRKARRRSWRTWVALRHGREGLDESTPADVRIETVRQLCHAAFDAHVPKPLDVPVWFIRATRLSGWSVIDETRDAAGWSELTMGGVTQLDIDCEHLQLFAPAYIGTMAERIDEALRDAASRSPSPGESE